MTGLAWVAESGFLEYPIALTNTLNVPRVANGRDQSDDEETSSLS